MTSSDLEARLQLITKHAPELRKAGVTGVTIGDIEFEMAPFEPDPVLVPATSTTTTAEHPDDPSRDPITFGGEVPRRRGDPEPTDEDVESWPKQQTAGGKPRRGARTS